MKSKISVKRILSVAINVIVWIVIVLAAAFIFMTLSTGSDGLADVFGYSPLEVQSPSMDGKESDSFKQGDLVILKKLDSEEIEKLAVGDIITFRDFNITAGSVQLNTHRIFEIKRDGSKLSFVTKGDANPVPDTEERVPSDIVGRYTGKIAGAGNVLKFMKSKDGFLICLVIPLLLFFLWRLYKLFVTIQQYKTASALDEAAANALTAAGSEGNVHDGNVMNGAEGVPPPLTQEQLLQQQQVLQQMIEQQQQLQQQLEQQMASRTAPENPADEEASVPAAKNENPNPDSDPKEENNS